jgi:hypothetical protein
VIRTGGVCCIDRLSARARRAEGINPQVFAFNLDVNVFRFGQHATRLGVNSSCCPVVGTRCTRCTPHRISAANTLASMMAMTLSICRPRNRRAFQLSALCLRTCIHPEHFSSEERASSPRSRCGFPG